MTKLREENARLKAALEKTTDTLSFQSRPIEERECEPDYYTKGEEGAFRKDLLTIIDNMQKSIASLGKGKSQWWDSDPEIDKLRKKYLS